MAEGRTHTEEKNRRIGIAVSVGTHLLLLLLFYFLLAWKAPNPPAPEYGIELNFGMDDAGYGEVQPQSPVASQESEIPETQAEEAASEPVENTEPATVENVSPSEAAQSEVVTQPEPSPAVVEKVTEPKPQPKEEKKPEKTQPKKETKPVEEPKKADNRSLFPGSDANNADQERAGEQANQGDREGATGDQGNPQGSVDSRALYGEQGGGQGGAFLNIAGWQWDAAPDKKDESNESGRIVFKFTIDQDGYVVNIQTVESNVSPRVTQFYKAQLQNTTFSPTETGALPAPQTTGTVTFIIKSR